MPLDLNEARRLHDRDPNNPEACPTCIHPENPHQMARWPCATALALGATGRSEWENQPAAHHQPVCKCGHARGTHKQDVLCRNCGCATYDAYIPCGTETGLRLFPGDGDRCPQQAGHTGAHTDENGVTW